MPGLRKKNLRKGKARREQKTESGLNRDIRTSQDVSICSADKVLGTHCAGDRELTEESLIPRDVQKSKDAEVYVKGNFASCTHHLRTKRMAWRKPMDLGRQEASWAVRMRLSSVRP